MTGPILFFAEHMLLITTLGLILGLALLVVGVRSFRRPAAKAAGRWRRWLWAALALVGTVLAGGTIFILTQIGPDLTRQALMVGRPAPPLEVSRVGDDEKISLADLKGQVVLVNFWATWCPPCREEMPDLDRLQRELGERGLAVLNVSDEQPETISGYLETHPMSTVHGYSEPLPWPEFGRPTTFVVDRTGVIREVIQGQRTYEQFSGLVSLWL